MGNEINQNVIDADNQAHQRLGVIKIYEDSKLNQNNETIYRIQINKEIQSEKKYQKWKSDLKTIDSQQARQVLYLPDNFKFQQTGFCGSSGILKLSFQYFPFILKTEVKNRRKMSQYFQQTELWYLLYNLVQAASIFQKRNKKLGDVHPKSVLLNDNGQVKIICQHSLPDQITNYDKIIQSITSDVYLAPEQIDQLFIQKGAYPNVDKCRAQVFSIGMTLLEAATLEDCYYVYNRGPLKVNKKKLVQLYKIIGQKYSHDFCDTLTNMLNQNPKSRRKSSQIYNMLYPHEYQILQLSPFKFQQAAYNPNIQNIQGPKQFQSQPSIARNIQNSKGYGYNY